MSVLQVESFDQELKVLLVAQESSLSRKVTEYLYSRQIAVVSTPLIHLNSSDFIKSLLQTNQFFKIIVVVNFSQPFDLSLQQNTDLLNYLKNIDIPKIFVIRVTSKIESTEQLLENWVRQLEHEDYLIEEIIKTFKKTKILIGQDVAVDDGAALQPYRSIIQAVPNGYLLDPQNILTPITETDFFNNISKELIKPDFNHYLIKGSAKKSEELLFKLSTAYKQLFNTDLINLDLVTSSSQLERFENINEITEAVSSSNIEEIVQLLVDNVNFNQLGVDPDLLLRVQNNSPLLRTQISKPFKKMGIDFQFEPIKNTDDSLKKVEDTQKNNNVVVNEVLNKKELAVEEPPNQILVEKNKKPLFKKDILDDSVSKIFSQKRTEQKTTRRTEKANVISRIRKKSKNKQAIFFIGLVVFVFGAITAISIIGLAINYQGSQKQTAKNISAFSNNEYNDISDLSVLGWQADILDKALDIQLIDKSKDLYQLNHLIVQTSALFNALQLQSINIYRQIFSTNFQGEGKLLQKGDYFQLLSSHQELVEKLSEQLSLFQAESKNFNYQIFSSQIQEESKKLDDDLRLLNNRLQTSAQLGSFLPDILGVNDKKTYYILLQDNQEIRPTGGFIQAIAKISLDEGRLIDQSVYTTSSIDSKVLGDVASIPEVEEYLGEPRLHLRDANWDPDLSTSSSHISWFLKEAINQPIDGIIAINYDLIRELLVIFGDLYLEEYDETINSSNLFARLESKAFEDKEEYSENNFHSLILEEILEKIKNASDKEIVQVQDVFYENLKKQQTSLFFSSTTINNAIGKLGWTGSILEPACPSRFSEDCQTDYLYQVEANVGVNKVNQYVTSRVNHIINIEQNRVVHERSIQFNNKSHSNVWPLGNYRSYIRFYLNKSATLDKILINGGEVPQESIKQYQQHDRSVIGVLLDVPAGDEKNITLLYSTPHTITEGSSYFFFEQPQPGIKNRLTSITVNHPDELRSELISPLVEVNQNQIVVTSELGSGFIAIKFAQQ